MASATTIKEIAELAGVSKTTVSLVLNGKGDRISESTAEKVRKIAEDSGYITNALSRGLFMRQSETLGLIIPDITNPFFTGIARGAEDRARLAGFNIIYGSADDLMQREDRLIKTFIHKRVDGLIMAHAAERTSSSTILNRSAIPLILIDRDYDSPNVVSRILSDNIGGAKAAVQHLLHRGRRKIICFTGPFTTSTAIDRRDGYIECMREAGIEVHEHMIFQGDYSVGAGLLMAEALMNSRMDFDAVFCCNDLIAIGAMRKFLEGGLSVPGDVSIVGFDDSDISALISPALTTVRQATYEMGFTAVDCMIRAKELSKLKAMEREEKSMAKSKGDGNIYKKNSASSMAPEDLDADANDPNIQNAYFSHAQMNSYTERHEEVAAGRKHRKRKKSLDPLTNSFYNANNNNYAFIRDYSHPSPIGKAYTAKPDLEGKTTRSFDYNPFVPHIPASANEIFPAYVILKTELIVRETT